MNYLTITGYSDEKFSTKISSPNQYVAMLNPANFDLSFPVDYSQEGSGSSGSTPKFRAIPSATLSFELVIDCTGVVDSSRTDLKTELDTLANVVIQYQGDIHRPAYVSVIWGNTLNFNGVLTNMSISYTFFKPNGDALRAKVKLDFRSYVDADTLAKEQNQQSPDVTHHILVRDGDSLPLIAQSIYRRPDYFVALARANRLDKFRHLTGGTTLLAPPLKSAEGHRG
jgi:hypothetical protein